MLYKCISGCVVTFNDERSIAGCLESLALVCDEIVVIDARSSDRTRELAAQLGARVIEGDFRNARAQRQFAVNAAKNDWVLSLDAGERLSPQLAAEIVRINLHGLDVRAAYEMTLPAGDAGFEVRLFDRRRAALSGGATRERVIAYGPVGQFRNAVLPEPQFAHGRQASAPGSAAHG